MKYAAAGELLIFVLFVIGSVISSIVQNQKKAKEEREGGQPGRKPSRGEPPVPHWPKMTQPWEQELKRLIEGKTAVPPKVPPQTGPATARNAPPKMSAPAVLPPRQIAQAEAAVASPLRESTTAYMRAAQLDAKVQARLEHIEKTTETARPDAFTRPGTAGTSPAFRWVARPQNIRDAFVASLIFGKPHALSPSEHFEPL